MILKWQKEEKETQDSTSSIWSDDIELYETDLKKIPGVAYIPRAEEMEMMPVTSPRR